MGGYYFLQDSEIDARPYLALVSTTSSDANKVIWKIWPRNLMRITGVGFSNDSEDVIAVGYTSSFVEYIINIRNAREQTQQTIE